MCKKTLVKHLFLDGQEIIVSPSGHPPTLSDFDLRSQDPHAWGSRVVEECDTADDDDVEHAGDDDSKDDADDEDDDEEEEEEEEAEDKQLS